MRRLPALLVLAAACCAAPAPTPQPDLVLFDGENVTGIAGLAPERDTVAVGAGAGRWRDLPAQPSIALPVPRDWRGYHRLRLRLHSAKPVPARIMVIVWSENPASEGIDYYGYGLSLAFQGWREFSFPIGGRNGTREPLGWDQITGLTLTADGWGNAPNAEADLILDDVRLVFDPPRPGPLLTDAEFFAALDLERADLAAVKAAVSRDDLAAAKQAFLDHLRERAKPVWWFDWRDRPRRDRPLTGGSDGWDYFGTSFTVDWTGWKLIELPLERFGGSRQPLGWQQINYLGLSTTYGERRPSPETALALDQMELVGEQPLLLAGFEQATDAERWRGVRIVADPVHDGRGAGLWRPATDAAELRCTAIPNDWRPYRAVRFWCWSAAATGDVVTVLADSDTPDVAGAEEALAHRYRGHFLGDDIDWEANARQPGDPAFTREWTYTLNRFAGWVALGDAYWKTGDEKYAREWIEQMRDWVEDNPYPLDGTGNDTLTWRTIEAGIRTSGSWPETLFRFLGSPSLTADDAVLFCKSWIEHARHLMRITVEHPQHGGNWVTMECNGLGTLGLLLPEAKDAPLWFGTAADRMNLELERQVYPDGAQMELTGGYHQVALRNFVGLLKFARLNEAPMPPEYLQRLERMYRYNLLAADPLGFLPPLNDSGYVAVASSLREAAELFDDPLFAWGASGGQDGAPPAETSLAFPWAGQYVMRSGWGPRDAYLLFEAGPYGTGHQHEDKLSLCLTALGRRLLTEGGTYSYDASKYRRYVLGTWAHNTVLVDGQGQRREGLPATYQADRPLDNLWLTNATFDAADGGYDHGYGPGRAIRVRHQRTVVFVKPSYWVVVDRLTPADAAVHRYDILWHLAGDEAERDPTTLAGWGTEAGGANLLVTPAAIAGLGLDIVVGREEPVLGFAPAASRTPSAVLNYRLEAPGPVTLAWVLTPFEGARPDVAAELARQGEAVTVTVRGPEPATVRVAETVTVTR